METSIARTERIPMLLSSTCWHSVLDAASLPSPLSFSDHLSSSSLFLIPKVFNEGVVHSPRSAARSLQCK